MEPDRHYDRTLVDWEIVALVEDDPKFIENFARRGLKGASYDIHAGSECYVAMAGRDTLGSGGISTFPPRELTQEANLGKVGYCIEPGRNVVIRSRECIHMPNNMFGRLSLRATWALRGLSYATGIVDPGYWGYLFIALVNDSETNIEIPVLEKGSEHLKGDDALVSLTLTILSKDAENPLNQDKQTTLPSNRRPRPPKDDPDNPVLLTQKINGQQTILSQISTRMSNLETRVDRAMEATRDFRSYQVKTTSVLSIVEFGFLAMIAGITAAAGTGAVQYGFKAGAGVPVIIVAVAALVILVGFLTFLGTRWLLAKRQSTSKDAVQKEEAVQKNTPEPGNTP